MIDSLEITSDNASESLKAFYSFLWGKKEGLVYLPHKTPLSQWNKRMFKWPAAEKQVIAYTLSESAKGNDVYCSPVIFRPPTGDEKPSATKDRVIGSNVLWADFDSSVPSWWDGPDDGSRQIAGEGGLTPDPTLRVNSGTDNHEHIYWRLDEFSSDTEWIEKCNRAIAYTLKADTSGWDVNQVLRPPHTTNHYNRISNPEKRPKPTLASVHTYIEINYPLSRFNHLKSVKQLVSEALKISDIPNVEKVIAKYPFSDAEQDLIFAKEIPEGERSSALMRVGYIGAEKGMLDAEIYSLLLFGDDRWGKFKFRTDRELRLRDIINRARIKYPTGLTTPAGLLRQANNSDGEIVTGGQLVYGWQEFIDSDIKIEWALEGLLEVGGIGMISSAPGIGKTQMSIQLAHCCALGVPFFRWMPKFKMKIGIFSLEMSAAPLKHFFEAMNVRFNEEEKNILNENIRIIPIGSPLPLDTVEGKKFLENILEEEQFDGVIFDSYGKIMGSSTTDEVAIKQLNDYLARIRARYGCFLWFVHHNRKAQGDNKKPVDLSDLYGNQYIAAEASSVLMLWRELNDNNEEDIHVVPVKMRLSGLEPSFSVCRQPTLNFIEKENKVLSGIMDQVTRYNGELKQRERSTNGNNGPRNLFDFG